MCLVYLKGIPSTRCWVVTFKSFQDRIECSYTVAQYGYNWVLCKNILLIVPIKIQTNVCFGTCSFWIVHGSQNLAQIWCVLGMGENVACTSCWVMHILLSNLINTKQTWKFAQNNWVWNFMRHSQRINHTNTKQLELYFILNWVLNVMKF
jgi:hypothetical protein